MNDGSSPMVNPGPIRPPARIGPSRDSRSTPWLRSPRLPQSAVAQSIAIEADALAYPLRGYSAILRVTHESGLSYALGTGRYSLPTFLVKGQSTYDEAGWKATSEAMQVVGVEVIASEAPRTMALL